MYFILALKLLEFQFLIIFVKCWAKGRTKEGVAKWNARIACCECNFGAAAAAAARPRLLVCVNNFHRRRWRGRRRGRGRGRQMQSTNNEMNCQVQTCHWRAIATRMQQAFIGCNSQPPSDHPAHPTHLNKNHPHISSSHCEFILHAAGS